MRILQVAPEISPGSGVAGVAFNLEAQWLRLGIDVQRCTLEEAHGGWFASKAKGSSRHLMHAGRVVWFSVVGTVVVRRRMRRDPDLVVVCHNDVVAGDVYVNHGILVASMRARGHFWWRMARNPVHLFTAARDHVRYGPRGPHRLIVNLATAEEELLRVTYPRLAADTAVVVNGVDTTRFVPATAEGRTLTRDSLGVSPTQFLTAFVGHEFDRKGLSYLLDAHVELPSRFVVVVVGGSPDMIAAAERGCAERGIADRVRFVGTVSSPVDLISCADAFCLPSSYEASPLVVLEAMSCGVPVVATPTGSTPDVVSDGRDGFLVLQAAGDIAAALQRVDVEAARMRPAARETAERHDWELVARRYLDLLRPPLEGPQPDRHLP